MTNNASTFAKPKLNKAKQYNIDCKTAVTKMNSVQPNTIAQLADLMCHRVQTTNRNVIVLSKDSAHLLLQQSNWLPQ